MVGSSFMIGRVRRYGSRETDVGCPGCGEGTLYVIVSCMSAAVTCRDCHAAFTLGELLDPETVIIHIDKANAAYHGLYQVINQQFLEQTWPQVRYVYREQDLGAPGLRRAKESYHPHHIVEKFTVKLR